MSLAKEAHKGKISSRRVQNIMNKVGEESNQRRNYHLVVDSTIWAGGDLKPGDMMNDSSTIAHPMILNLMNQKYTNQW